MSYIDLTYYTSTYYGKSAGSDFDRYAARASDDVDMATMYQITALADLDAAAQTMVKKATCAQVEWYVNQGDIYNEQPSSGSESIGSYSHGSSGSIKSPVALCPRSMAYLEQTGLLNRSCAVIGAYAHHGECDCE